MKKLNPNPLPPKVEAALHEVLSYAVEHADDHEAVHADVKVVDAWLNSLAKSPRR